MFYVRRRTITKNRVVTVFDRYPEQTALLKKLGDLFGSAGRVQLAQVKVSEIDRGLDFIGDINTDQAVGDDDPCIVEFFARLIDAEIDGISGFRNAKKLAAYAGLVPSTYSSGGKTVHGKIIRQGNKCWGLRRSSNTCHRQRCAASRPV